VLVVAAVRYRFRYDGLRLLRYSNDKYFVVSRDWRPNGQVFVVADDAEVRVTLGGPR
jgi:hypothetical protein